MRWATIGTFAEIQCATNDDGNGHSVFSIGGGDGASMTGNSAAKLSERDLMFVDGARKHQFVTDGRKGTKKMQCTVSNSLCNFTVKVEICRNSGEIEMLSIRNFFEKFYGAEYVVI